jgi:hypothetical protein
LQHCAGAGCDVAGELNLGLLSNVPAAKIAFYFENAKARFYIDASSPAGLLFEHDLKLAFFQFKGCRKKQRVQIALYIGFRARLVTVRHAAEQVREINVSSGHRRTLSAAVLGVEMSVLAVGEIAGIHGDLGKPVPQVRLSPRPVLHSFGRSGDNLEREGAGLA